MSVMYCLALAENPTPTPKPDQSLYRKRNPGELSSQMAPAESHVWKPGGHSATLLRAVALADGGAKKAQRRRTLTFIEPLLCDRQEPPRSYSAAVCTVEEDTRLRAGAAHARAEPGSNSGSWPRLVASGHSLNSSSTWQPWCQALYSHRLDMVLALQARGNGQKITTQCGKE